jgi:hypothetical protein
MPGPEETPRTSVSSALFSELLGLRSRSLESLKSLPIAQLRALAADPVHALASLAQALGVDWDSSVEETLAFLRQRLEGDYAVDEFGFDP